MITEAADKLDRKRARRIESHTHLLKGKAFQTRLNLSILLKRGKLPPKTIGSPSGEVLLEGYMMKLSGTSIMRRWSKRYVHILADRLEWRNEAQVSLCLPVVGLLFLLLLRTRNGRWLRNEF